MLLAGCSTPAALYFAARDVGNAAICSAVIALARGCGLQVIAEGVEEEAELAWLEDKGCDLFQGFYFARPMPAEAFGQRLVDRAA